MALLELVKTHRGEGRSVGRGAGQCGGGAIELLPVEEERGREEGRTVQFVWVDGRETQMIEAVKESHPEYRHRHIQGVLQQRGVYLSASAIYGHLKELGQVEPYERRAAPTCS